MASTCVVKFEAGNMVRLAAVLVALAGTSVAWAQNARAKTPANTPAQQPPVMQPYMDPGQMRDNSLDEIARLNMPASAGPKGDTRVSVTGDDFTVDLHVNDEDLGKVLEMLSLQSQKNIIASKNVSARVTANLYGVTFLEALDSLLAINGFVYQQQGNFIYIYTRDEWKEVLKATRQRISRTIKLNYLSAIDASEFVTPLLSADGGQIKSNGKTRNFPAMGETPIGNDEYANDAQLVVYDYEENVNEIESLLKQIDTRPAQVLIEATILQTALTEQNAFGVDFAVLANLQFQQFVGIGGPLHGPQALIGGRAVTGSPTPFPADGGGTALGTNIGNVAGPGGLKIGVVSNGAAAFLRVLDEVTDTTILSNPKLLVLNRQVARVLVGRKVGYLSTTSTTTASTQTVEFLDTGTQLYVRPFVMGDGMIRMELKPQVSEAVIRDTTDAKGAAVTIPDEVTNELVTNVVVRDGQTIVLGGLFRESTQSTRRQIPLLGDIPLIGQAFRGNEDDVQRSEIIFMITPTKTNDAALAEAGERGAAYADHARTGALEGTLWFSRSKITAQRNMEAQRLAQAGDTKKALWNVERSLRLDPSQPEMIALREKLTGEQSKWPVRSLLQRIMHGEATTRVVEVNDQTQSLNTNSPNSPVPETPGLSTFAQSGGTAANTTGTNNAAGDTTANHTGNTGANNSGNSTNSNTQVADASAAAPGSNTGMTTGGGTTSGGATSFASDNATTFTGPLGSWYFPSRGTGEPATRTAMRTPVGMPGVFGSAWFFSGGRTTGQTQLSNVSENGAADTK